MTAKPAFPLLAGATLALLGFTGCLNLKPAIDTTRFYLLSAVAEPGGAGQLAAGPPFRLGQVELPDYLTRPGLAWRTKLNQVTYAGLDQWAEPLADSVPRVLGENLLRLLGPGRFLTGVHPGDRPVREIQLTILRFDLSPAGHARIEAIGRLVDYQSRELLAQQTLTAEQAFDPAAPDQTGAVAALSACLARLAAQSLTLSALPGK